MYEGVLSPPLRTTPNGCMLWDEGCLSQHSRWQVSSLVKTGLVIISLLLAYLLLEQRCISFLFFHGKFKYNTSIYQAKLLHETSLFIGLSFCFRFNLGIYICQTETGYHNSDSHLLKIS